MLHPDRYYYDIQAVLSPDIKEVLTLDIKEVLDFQERGCDIVV